MLFTNANSPAFLALIFVYSTLSRSGGGLSGTFLQYGSRLPLRSPPSDLLPLPREPAPPPLPPPPTKVSDYYGSHLVSMTVGHDCPSPATVFLSPSPTTATTLPSPVLLPVILALLSIFGIGVAYVRLFGASKQRSSFVITASVPSCLSKRFSMVSRLLMHVITMVCFLYGVVQIVADVTGLPPPSQLLRIVVSKLSLSAHQSSAMQIAVRLAELKHSLYAANGLYEHFATTCDSFLSEIDQWCQDQGISPDIFTLSNFNIVGGRLEIVTFDVRDVLTLGRLCYCGYCLIAIVALAFASRKIVNVVISHNKSLNIIQRFGKWFEAIASPSREVLRTNFPLLPSSMDFISVVPFIIHGGSLLLNATMTVAIPLKVCRQLFSIPLAENILSALSLAIFVMECAMAAFKDKCASCYERLSRRLRTSIASVKATRIVDTSAFPSSTESINESFTDTSEDDSVFSTVPDSLDVISPMKKFNLRVNTGFIFTPTRSNLDLTGSPTTSTPSAASSYFDSSSAALSGELTPATSISDSSFLLPKAKEDEPGLAVATGAQREEAIEQSTEDIDALSSSTSDTSSSISAPKIDDSDLQAQSTGTSQHQEAATKPIEERHTRCSASAPLVALVEDDGLGPWTVVEPKRCKRRYRNKFPPVNHSNGEPLFPAPQRTPPAPPTVSSSNSSEESSVSTLMREFSKLSL